MKRFTIPFFIAAASVSALVLGIAPASAATCADLGGSGCVSIGTCQQFQSTNSKIQCLNADDCKASDGDACWYNPSSSPGQNCVNAGGFCNESCETGEENLGTMGCPENPNTGKPNTCCRTKAQAPAATAPTAPGQAPAAAPAGGILQALPSDVRARVLAGNATLDDIVRTGVAFATFLFGLSAALFFVVFVYGGALLLLSFGQSGRVEKGKSAIKGAAIGIFFVMAAWTIVQYVVKSIGATPGETPGATQPATQAPDPCASKGPGWQCTPFPSQQGKSAAQTAAYGNTQGFECVTGACPKSPNHVVCCKKK